MAALDGTALTLADWAKRLDPDGGVSDIVLLLKQTNRILDDCMFMPSNQPTSHQVTVQTGLPDIYWRLFNQGIPSSKSTTAQVVEPLAMVEARSNIDIDLAMLNGNTPAFRLSESRPFLEAMNQGQAEALIYANPAVDSAKYLGIAPRYSSLGAGNGQNILDAGGVEADNTSVYLVVWGDQTVFCPFPKGSQAGLLREDLGRQTAWNVGGVTGYQMEVFSERFQWKNGLCVKDWRYIVRIANIDVSDLVAGTGSQASTASTDLIKLMIRALDRPDSLDMGRAAFYCNRTVRSALAIKAMERQANVLSIEKGVESFRMNFLGVPIHLVDRILNTESLVS